MKTWNKIGKVVYRIGSIVGIVAMVGVALLVILNVCDVGYNKVTGSNILGAYEISQNILMVAVFAAFGYAQVHKSHIHMTLLINALPGKTKFIPFFLTGVLACVTGAYCTYSTVYRGISQMNSNAMSDILHYPLYPFYFLEAIAMAVFVLVLIYDTVMSLLAMFNDDIAQQVHATW
jgi:TRAP-type C4-dicarboxylate transport system permease small subunit